MAKPLVTACNGEEDDAQRGDDRIAKRDRARERLGEDDIGNAPGGARGDKHQAGAQQQRLLQAFVVVVG